MPLGVGKEALGNLAVAKEAPRAIHGHVIVVAVSCWAALLFTTCGRKNCRNHFNKLFVSKENVPESPILKIRRLDTTTN